MRYDESHPNAVLGVRSYQSAYRLLGDLKREIAVDLDAQSLAFSPAHFRSIIRTVQRHAQPEGIWHFNPRSDTQLGAVLMLVSDGAAYFAILRDYERLLQNHLA
ncbi:MULTISPECIES: hypothetical protein [Mesorhizobium]|jgi:hypothetical protein|uniref:hypothetical protein n=1 Tax=Mesorhizobium TaxID=68287 RepID=UPI0003D0355F|nr:hypothetical protein X738_20510 [Mesorhizobium sp. LNHC209A00]